MAFMNKCVLLPFLFLFSVLNAWPSQVAARVHLSDDASMRQRYKQWIVQFKKVYADGKEEEARYNIFKENVVRIEAFNHANEKPYKLSVNEFADLTEEEFRATRTGLKTSATEHQTRATDFRYRNYTEVPPSVDWREKGAVTPVKSQGDCGSCWAFAAVAVRFGCSTTAVTLVAAVEGLTKIKSGKLVSLSEQEQLDCDTRFDGACRGGWVTTALDFIVQSGLTTEDNYPYTAIRSTCQAEKEANRAATISGHEHVPQNDEQALMQAVANQPVAIGVDSSGFGQFYSSGVFTGDCGTNLDHGMAIVGYGTTPDGMDYWIVKNSWGPRWGEGGYIRMQRNVQAKEGLCGLAMDANYPTA